MADPIDRTIGQLPELAEITDDSLLPVEDTGTAYHTSGAAWKAFVQAAIAAYVAAAAASAGSASDSAAAAAVDADAAEAARQAVEDLVISSSVQSAGSTPTLSRTVSQGVVHLHFGLAPGATGAQGIQGPQGPQGVQGPKGDTGTAAAVETAGMYYFAVDNDSTSETYGHLKLTYSGSTAPDFTINSNGHLIWTVA